MLRDYSFFPAPQFLMLPRSSGSIANFHFGYEADRLGLRLPGSLAVFEILLPPIYVKPFVKRQKNDAADSAAIAEACPASEHALLRTERVSKSKWLPYVTEPSCFPPQHHMLQDRQVKAPSEHLFNRKHFTRAPIDYDFDVVIIAVHAAYDKDISSAGDVINILHAIASRYAYGLALANTHVTKRRRHLHAGIDAYATGTDLNAL
jgi:hypothetical protein